jgi:hypothetical protein
VRLRAVISAPLGADGKSRPAAAQPSKRGSGAAIRDTRETRETTHPFYRLKGRTQPKGGVAERHSCSARSQSKPRTSHLEPREQPAFFAVTIKQVVK